MLFKFALRNILRNRKRTFLTVLSIFFAALISAVAIAWGKGLINLMIDNYTKYQTGDIKIATEEYFKRERFFPVDEIIPDAGNINTQIKKIPGVVQTEERIRFGIMLAKGDNTLSAVGIGLDLQKSRFNLAKKVMDGKLNRTGIYIGKTLAKKLGVQINDKLLLATKTSEGGLNGIKLSVNGILDFKISLFDKKFFFISLEDAKKLLKIRQGITELYIFTRDRSMIETIQQQTKRMLPEGINARNYKEQLGGLYDTFKTQSYIMFFLVILILFLASFIVINTMMMSIFERLREIGTIKAMGMTDKQLFLNFTIEGGLLGMIGSIPGAAAGYLLLAAISEKGINYQKSFQGVDLPMEYIIKPKPSLEILIITILLAVVITSLAAMIPARYARKLQPAEALRKI